MLNKGPQKLSLTQIKDTGLVFTLMLILAGVFTKNQLFMTAAVVILVIDMVWPRFFYPFAIVWFGFSGALGHIMSKLILFIIFLSLVLPIGTFRRFLGKDTLNLKAWRQGKGSVFKVRDHLYSSDDLKKPY